MTSTLTTRYSRPARSVASLPRFMAAERNAVKQISSLPVSPFPPFPCQRRSRDRQVTGRLFQRLAKLLLVLGRPMWYFSLASIRVNP